MVNSVNITGLTEHQITIIIIGAFVLLLILIFTNRIPTLQTFRIAMRALNDRGGNILVLLILTGWFFHASLGLFYYAIEAMKHKELDDKSAVLLMGLQFVTGVAFGGVFGALLKTMTGSDSQGRGGDILDRAGDHGSTRETVDTHTVTMVGSPPITGEKK